MARKKFPTVILEERCEGYLDLRGYRPSENSQ